MQITKEQVKSWHACTDGFRWFLDKFPQGGAYADVHGALIADKRFDDARWLVDKMYRTHLDKAEFIQAETAATDKMVGELTSSGDDARIGSSGYNARITASGKNSVVACAGSIERIVLGENGCTSVPWHDGKRIRIAVAYVGENGIEANTPYYVNDEGQFVKVEE
ncbi:hypothetical protein MNN85_000933 [Salmonella enterica]|nr:hypothetical protein [Salmonella enterica]EGM4323999.1 hypothetical protein [Salmonella enterica]EGM4325767.1 hypothetical protein [Salmonella enterica]EIY8799304.1 hypothetical protein [Salmonella enterica]